jgi:hypothetical protein
LGRARDILILFVQRLQALRLENKEKRFLAKQSRTGNKYNVLRNISTQADLRDNDGDMRSSDVKIDKTIFVRRITPSAGNKRFWNLPLQTQ